MFQIWTQDILACNTNSVVPECVQWTIVHEFVHILGERELNVLYFCLMDVILNVFILAFVSGALSQFNFVQESARFPGKSPAKTNCKQALMCRRKITQSGNTSRHRVAPLHVSSKCEAWRQKQMTAAALPQTLPPLLIWHLCMIT